MPVRAVIFDYGNVLCPMPRLSDYEEMRSLAGIEEPQFQDYIWRYRLDYDRGTVDGTGYWRGVAQMSGKTFSDDLIQKLVAADIALWLTPDPILLRWTRDLHDGGAKTAILSNMHLDLAVYLRGNAAWLRQFDHATFSAEIGLVKPDPAIYLQSLKGLDVRAEEAVFIDDNAANVEGARALGINALRFESVAQLAAEVQGFGLPPVPMDEAIH
ncbi:MAG TPA: HAD family phosphatase [Terriglobia bacterium]|nr:HAD family phosphatase [Terriglobia bacterium]